MLRNLLIPVEDNVTLAAGLCLPTSGDPAPTLVSFNPYRKDDVAGAFSAPWCERFLQAGYAHLVVDTRGTGVVQEFLLFRPTEGQIQVSEQPSL